MRKIKMWALLVLASALLVSGCGNKETQDTQADTIGKAGTYTGEYEELTITAPDTILENASASKIVITKEVGDGDVILRNVEVATLEVYGGGENSIHLEASVVDNVISHKEEGIVRIVAEAATSVQEFDSTNTIVVIKGGAEVAGVTAKANTEVVVEEDAKAETITVADETAKANVSGAVATVAVAAPKAEVVVAETATVAEVKVDEAAAQAKLTVTGAVETLTVAAPAAEVTVEQTAKVAEVKVDEKADSAKLTVTGEVSTMTVAAARTEVKVEEAAKVAEVKVEENAAGTKLTVTGAVNTMSVAAAKTEVKVEETAKVAEVKVEAKAENTALTVNGTVAKVETQAATTVEGTGKVEKIETTKKELVTVAENTTAVKKEEVVENKNLGTTTQNTAQNTTQTPAQSTTTNAQKPAETKPAAPAPVAPEKDEEEEKKEESKPSSKPSHTHVYTGKITTAATCTTDGVKTFTCSGCSNSYTEKVAATGHKVVDVAAKAPTCTETGLTAGKQCSVCKTFTVAQTTVAATDHKYNDGTVTTNPACTTVGVKTFTCSVCNDTKTEEVAALGHSVEKNEGFSNCTVCGEYAVNGTVVDYAVEKIEGYSNIYVKVNGESDKEVCIADAAGMLEFAEIVTNKGRIHTNTFVLVADIDMSGIAWNPSIKVDGYNGAGVVKIDGNGHKITHLSTPLFAGGFAGKSGIVIKNLTIADSKIVSTNDLGSGAFIECVDSMPTIELENCHLVDSSVTGSRTGGLIGWTSGYNVQNDGPVDTYVTIENCSVIRCEITGAGTVGGINGHAGANPATFTTISNCEVKDCTLTSNDDSYRVGVVVGTANVGKVTINNITESGNTLLQNNNGTEIARPEGQSNLYGRFVPQNGSGKLTIDGTAIN